MPGTGGSSATKECAIQQIVNRAVVSAEVVDLLTAAGVSYPDISILSDELLAEVQQMEKKNQMRSLSLSSIFLRGVLEIFPESGTGITQSKTQQ